MHRGKKKLHRVLLTQLLVQMAYKGRYTQLRMNLGLDYWPIAITNGLLAPAIYGNLDL